MKHARLSLVLVLPLLALAGPVAGWRVSAGAPRNAGNVIEVIDFMPRFLER